MSFRYQLEFVNFYRVEFHSRVNLYLDPGEDRETADLTDTQWNEIEQEMAEQGITMPALLPDFITRMG